MFAGGVALNNVPVYPLDSPTARVSVQYSLLKFAKPGNLVFLRLQPKSL